MPDEDIDYEALFATFKEEELPSLITAAADAGEPVASAVGGVTVIVHPNGRLSPG